MTDRHTERNERKPKPVKLSPAPWERAQGGKSGFSGLAQPGGENAAQRGGK